MMNALTRSDTWPCDQGIAVHVEAEPDNNSLKLKYPFENTNSSVRDAVQLHTCIPTTEAPGFYPPPRVRHAPTNWTELYQRLHDGSKGWRFTFAQTRPAPTELHLSLMQARATPVRWGVVGQWPEDLRPAAHRRGPEPRRVVPRAILLSQLSSGVAGCLLLSGVMLAIRNLPTAQLAGNPAFSLLTSVRG